MPPYSARPLIPDQVYIHQAHAFDAMVLVNLGTPDAPKASAVRRYLAEFLSDPRVIEIPRLIWKVILHGVILRIRPGRSAKAYQKIWREDGSPLLTLSQALRDLVQLQLQSPNSKPEQSPNKRPLQVALAMRYGRPAIGEVLRGLRDQGARRFVIVPLYPQYSATTTASVFDAVADELKSWRVVPDLQFVSDYYTRNDYLDALTASIQAHWATHGRADQLMFSFHGIPERYFKSGDPYFCHCHATARRVAERLNLHAAEYTVSFQSRVGREKWLQPYTDETLKALPGRGVSSVQVVCPGFAVDCLETLEEIAEENQHYFLQAGGQRFEYIPCLNAESSHAAVFAAIAHERLQSLPNASGDEADLARAERNRQRLQANFTPTHAMVNVTRDGSGESA